jgi:hypothetical protein
VRIRIPNKKTREEFRLIYELEGAQRALNYLANYHGIRKMRIVLNGKKVGKGCEGVYFSNKAFFTKKGLTKRTVLHEFYHHLIETKGLELPERTEEKEANDYAKRLLRA